MILPYLYVECKSNQIRSLWWYIKSRNEKIYTISEIKKEQKICPFNKNKNNRIKGFSILKSHPYH